MKQSSKFKLSHNPMGGGSLMSLLIVNTLCHCSHWTHSLVIVKMLTV